MDRSELIAAFQDTLSRSMSHDLKKGTETAARSSKVFYEGFRTERKLKQRTAEIVVEENTTFASAKKYLSYGKTAVLNFANPEIPGGGVTKWRYGSGRVSVPEQQFVRMFDVKYVS